MSFVTGIMLLLGASDWDEPPIAEVQQWLSDRGWPQLKDVSGEGAGSKHPQFEAWCAGFNYFRDKDEFIEFVRSRQWLEPDEVILIINPENDPMSIHRPASGMSAYGQDPQGLEAKPASPTA